MIIYYSAMLLSIQNSLLKMGESLRTFSSAKCGTKSFCSSQPSRENWIQAREGRKDDDCDGYGHVSLSVLTAPLTCWP